MSSSSTRSSRLAVWLRALVANQLELHERHALLDRPWEEDFLHWAHDRRGSTLHGHLVPPAGWRRRSVTSTGWCPGRVGRARASEQAGS